MHIYYIINTNNTKFISFKVFNKEEQKKIKKRNAQETKGKVKLIKMDAQEMEIDFIGFHTSLLNAYRRIILAEVSC